MIDVTREILLEEGLRGITMRKVAERVGVSATAIYRHFADRNALLAAAQVEAGQRLARYFARALAGKTPRERLHLTGRQYLRFALKHRKEYQVLFMAWDELPVDLPSPGGGYSPTFQFLVDRVGDCVQARLLPPPTDVFEMAMLCWSVCHGLASLYLPGPARRRMGEREFLRLADRVLVRTLDGMLGGSRSQRAPVTRNSLTHGQRPTPAAMPRPRRAPSATTATSPGLPAPPETQAPIRSPRGRPRRPGRARA